MFKIVYIIFIFLGIVFWFISGSLIDKKNMGIISIIIGIGYFIIYFNEIAFSTLELIINCLIAIGGFFLYKKPNTKDENKKHNPFKFDYL